MKKLHRYMLKSFIGPFIATFFVAMFVLIMQFLWQYIDDLVGKGLSAGVVTQLLFYVSLTLVPMGLPLAVLLASIMTFGNLGENYELTAMKSAGISLYRIMFPLVVMIVGLTIAAFFFSNNVLPYANLKYVSLLYDIRKAKPEMSLKEGFFINDIDHYSIKVDHIDKETGMMYNLLIYNHTDINNNYDVIVADSGLMNSRTGYMEVELFHGYNYTDEGLKSRNKKTFPYRRVQFDRHFFAIPLEDNELKRTDEESWGSHYAMKDIAQLEHDMDSLNNVVTTRKTTEASTLLKNNYTKRVNKSPARDSTILEEIKTMLPLSCDSLYAQLDIKELKTVTEMALRNARDVKQAQVTSNSVNERQEEIIRRHQIEVHRKFTLSFACFIFFFIGAPLGAIIRKGGFGLSVVLSVFLFILYYVIWMMGERAAREGALQPWQGMWLSSVILLPMGIILTYKAVTDSEVMNQEGLTRFLKKFKKIFRPKNVWDTGENQENNQ